jgi:hypothetical protein
MGFSARKADRRLFPDQRIGGKHWRTGLLLAHSKREVHGITQAQSITL